MLILGSIGKMRSLPEPYVSPTRSAYFSCNYRQILVDGLGRSGIGAVFPIDTL